MTTWLPSAAFLLSGLASSLVSSLASSSVSAAAPLEHAPFVRLERAQPPEPGRRYAARAEASRAERAPRRHRAYVLPGERLVLAVSPVGPTADVRARLEGEGTGDEGLVPHVWWQSRTMVPGGKRELVPEILAPPGAFDGAGQELPRALQEAEPMAVRLVRLDISEGARPGPLAGELSLSGRRVLELELEVLEPLPEAALDPVLAFHRGRLVDEDEAAWPEMVDRTMLLEDLEWLVELGVSHVTYYGAPDRLEEARELWREAGLLTEPLLVGWYPGPMAEVGEEQARQAQAVVEALRVSEDGRPRAFWVVDEPIREEVLLARKKAAIVRAGGGLSTATLQVETAHALRHEIDLHLMDNYLSDPADFEAAVRSVRAAGSTPWGYWQSFGESERFSRWNAGFRQLAEPTRGQCFYAWAHVVGDPFDDFDGAYRDMLMVHRWGGQRLGTLQLEGLRSGLSDLALARGAEALVREAKLEGLEDAALRRLERRLERAARKWSAARSSWGRYSWEDVARPGRDGGPTAAALEATRQDILEAVSAVQAARREPRP